MARIPFRLRIDAAERAALENSAGSKAAPISQFLNEPIKGYLICRGRKERSLEASLEDLEPIGRTNPGFQRAIDRVGGSRSGALKASR